MLYLNIRKTVHDFLDAHKYTMPLSEIDALDAKIAETIVQWGGDMTYRLYGETINHITGNPEEFAGQVIDLVENAVAEDPDIAVIVDDDYDALADAIKKAVITYGAFVWNDIAPAIPAPCDTRELHTLEIALMAVTIACEERIPLEDAIKLTAHYQAGVSDYGTPLITQEAAYAICDILEKHEDGLANGVNDLLARDEKAFLDTVTAKALSSMENALTDCEEV